MRAVLEAIAAGELRAEPRVLISNNPGCAATEAAERAGLPCRVINSTSAGGAEAADRAIVDALIGAGAELVVLSGYMRKLGPQTLARFSGRILNIHPALLPRHGGQGLYGRRVHEAVHASGDDITGATVHLVESDYDTGPVIAQVSTPVRAGDTVDDIEARVRALEPGLLVDTLRRLQTGEIRLPEPTGTA